MVKLLKTVGTLVLIPIDRFESAMAHTQEGGELGILKISLKFEILLMKNKNSMQVRIFKC